MDKHDYSVFKGAIAGFFLGGGLSGWGWLIGGFFGWVEGISIALGLMIIFHRLDNARGKVR